MDVEIQNFITIWLTAIASLVFVHQIAARLPGGATRLLCLLPIVYLFTILPLRLSSLHLAAPTIFYLVWLGNFKLLLFSFDQGPLSSTPPLSLLTFISIALLPIRPSSTIQISKNSQIHKSLAIFLFKFAILASIVTLYRFRDSIHPYIILVLYCCHVYLSVELILALTIVPVRALLGFDVEPQFNEPYLATSLQDFWGYRWNLMVTSILRPSVYHPIRHICTSFFGYRWALAPAAIATFAVSGLMHELIYYYMSRVDPTWEVTLFFILHGFCVAIEVEVKKVAVAHGWVLHRLLSGMLTLGFVGVTAAWLFFPQVIRNEIDLKAIDEYSSLVRFIRNNWPLW